MWFISVSRAGFRPPPFSGFFDWQATSVPLLQSVDKYCAELGVLAVEILLNHSPMYIERDG